MISSDRPLLLFMTGAGLVGLGISIYLTVVHYSVVPLACSSSGLVNCERVLASPYALVGPTSIPTSATGIVWFAVSMAIAGAAFGTGAEVVRLAHLLWAGLGLATVLYLVFVEIDRLGAICAWCTAAHVLVLATFLAALYRWQVRDRDPGRS